MYIKSHKLMESGYLQFDGFLGYLIMDKKKVQGIPEEYKDLKHARKRVISNEGKYAYIKCFYNNGIYWIGENTSYNSGNASGYFTLCLNTLTMPAFWQSNDYQQLRVCIDWLLEHGVDLCADPLGNYHNYCNMIKKFFPDYLHLLCPQWYWTEMWGKCKEAEVKAAKRYKPYAHIDELESLDTNGMDPG